MRPSGVAKAFSLAETILACFVLITATLVSASLYDVALNHSARIDKRYRGAQAAERRLEEIRSWSVSQHGTNGSLTFDQGWEAFHGVTIDDPEETSYSVTSTIEPFNLYSPSSEFELANFAAMEDENVPEGVTERRVLPASAYRVIVLATWGPSAAEQVTTTTVLTDPCRRLGWDPANAEDAIQLTYSTGSAPPGSLTPEASFTVDADVKDIHGQLVKNPVVQWYLDNDRTGSGTIETTPNLPTRATFINQVTIERDPTTSSDDLVISVPGEVRLVARVKMGGLEVVKATPPIQLLGTP